MTTAVRARARKPKPLVDVADLGDATGFVMSGHAIQRASERGIGVMEIYSALAQPDSTSGSVATPGAIQYDRGDIRVVAIDNVIKTVIDLDDDVRPVPRTPISPKVGQLMPTKKGGYDPALDEAWALMPHTVDEQEYRRIRITPPLARKLLDRNTHNRKIRPRDVRDWEDRFSTGQYDATHQGIALDVNAVLLDGQNRLTAAVNQEHTFDAWVGVGFPSEHMAIIDAGRGRNHSDVLQIEGETDTAVLGSTVRLTYVYLSSDGSMLSSRKVTNQTVWETFAADRARYREAMAVGRQMDQGINHRKVSRAAAGAAWYLTRRTNRERDVEPFFAGLITGAGVPSGDPRLVLMTRLGRNADEGKRGNSVMQLALLLKAWNQYATGARNVSLAAMVWRPKTEAMPAVAKFGTGG